MLYTYVAELKIIHTHTFYVIDIDRCLYIYICTSYNCMWETLCAHIISYSYIMYLCVGVVTPLCLCTSLDIIPASFLVLGPALCFHKCFESCKGLRAMHHNVLGDAQHIHPSAPQALTILGARLRNHCHCY